MALSNISRGVNATGDSRATNFTITASGTAHTKGAWTQIFSSTLQHSQLIALMWDDIGIAATNTATLLDVGIGAAGSEVVVISNINLGSLGHGSQNLVPLLIPQGSAVSLRCQSVIVSEAVVGRATLVPKAVEADVAEMCDTYGDLTASSSGTLLPTPSVINTKTGWQQITASTTRDARWLTWSLGSNQTAVNAAQGSFDIGYGAAASEQVLVGDIRWQVNLNEMLRPANFFVPCSLPFGTRLAVRFQSGTTSAASVPNIVLHTLI